MIDRDDYEAYVKAKKPRNGQAQSLEFLVQAQVRMENLTGDANFDRFLTYLQSSSESMNALLEDLERRICDPATHDGTEIMELKLAIARMMGRVEAMNAVIELPKAIIETGERARERLKVLEQGISEGD